MREGAGGHLVEEGVVEAAVEGVGLLHGEHADGELELEVCKACNLHLLHLPPVGDQHLVQLFRGEAGALGQEKEQRLAAGDVGRGVEEVLEGGDGCAADVEGVGGGARCGGGWAGWGGVG